MRHRRDKDLGRERGGTAGPPDHVTATIHTPLRAALSWEKRGIHSFVLDDKAGLQGRECLTWRYVYICSIADNPRICVLNYIFKYSPICKIKPLCRYCHTPIGMAKIKKTGQTGALSHCWWECKMVGPLGASLSATLK